MSSSITVRVARPEDAPAVERVLQASYPVLLTGAYDAELLAVALPAMTRPNPKLLSCGTFYLAELGELAVGCGGWTREAPDTGQVEAGVGHLRHFGTDAAFARHGIGRRIFNRCLEDARAAGLRQFDCYAGLNAEPFYTALGFRRVSQRDLPLNADTVLPILHMRREF